MNYFNCHSNGTTYEVLTVPTETKSFMSCGEDSTVRLFDLRRISKYVNRFNQSMCTKYFVNAEFLYRFNFRCHATCCNKNILIKCPSAVTSMCLSPISNNYIAVGNSDSHVRIYDRRYLSLIDCSMRRRDTRCVKSYNIPSTEKRAFRVTSINYSSDENELLVSYSSDHLYIFDLTANVCRIILIISDLEDI